MVVVLLLSHLEVKHVRIYIIDYILIHAGCDACDERIVVRAKALQHVGKELPSSSHLPMAAIVSTRRFTLLK